MDEPTKQEITRLLLEQVELDKQQVVMVGRAKQVKELLEEAITAGYGNLPAVEGIMLYLRRN